MVHGEQTHAAPAADDLAADDLAADDPAADDAGPQAPIGDDELAALALAADPGLPPDPDAVPLGVYLHQVAGYPVGGALPEWYMPPVTARRVGPGRRLAILAVVGSFLLIEAFGRITVQEARLVLVGDLADVFHSQVPEIRAAIEASPARDRITLAGFVPDAELVFLYSRAYALVLPSLLEGFGLPAVEAMACGTPVLASRAGSLPEVVGPAGDLFDPMSAQDMAECVELFLANPDRRDRLARIALERACLFTWERSARSLVACFEELADETGTAAESA